MLLLERRTMRIPDDDGSDCALPQYTLLFFYSILPCFAKPSACSEPFRSCGAAPPLCPLGCRATHNSTPPPTPTTTFNNTSSNPEPTAERPSHLRTTTEPMATDMTTGTSAYEGLSPSRDQKGLTAADQYRDREAAGVGRPGPQPGPRLGLGAAGRGHQAGGHQQRQRRRRRLRVLRLLGMLGLLGLERRFLLRAAGCALIQACRASCARENERTCAL